MNSASEERFQTHKKVLFFEDFNYFIASVGELFVHEMSILYSKGECNGSSYKQYTEDILRSFRFLCKLQWRTTCLRQRKITMAFRVTGISL